MRVELPTHPLQLRPGHYLTCQSGHIEQHSYWDIEYPDKVRISYLGESEVVLADCSKRLPEHRSQEEMIEGVQARMLEAIRLRLRADVPVGVYLSGGIDSSAIAGMMTHLVRERGEGIGNDRETERVSCFSVAFDEDSEYDESGIVLPYHSMSVPNLARHCKPYCFIPWSQALQEAHE